MDNPIEQTCDSARDVGAESALRKWGDHLCLLEYGTRRRNVLGSRGAGERGRAKWLISGCGGECPSEDKRVTTKGKNS